ELVEPDEGLDQRRVVSGQRGVTGAGLAVGLPRTEPAAIGTPQLAQQELAVGHGGVLPLVALEDRRGIGERMEEERVPLGEDLVVAAGLRSSRSRREQSAACLLDEWRAAELAA